MPQWSTLPIRTRAWNPIMNKVHLHSVTLLVLAAACFAPVGCKSSAHSSHEAASGTVIGCQSCFDEIHKVRTASGSRAGILHGKTQVKHQCPSCKTEMVIYAEHDVLMVKCAHCAPEGVACDKCLAPAHGDHHATK